MDKSERMSFPSLENLKYMLSASIAFSSLVSLLGTSIVFVSFLKCEMRYFLNSETDNGAF